MRCKITGFLFILAIFFSITFQPTPAKAADPSVEFASQYYGLLFGPNVDSPICWACGVISKFYESSVIVSYKFSEAIADNLIQIVGVFLGLYVLLMVLKIFMPFGAGGVGEIFNDIVSKIVQFILILTFLGSYPLIWQYILSPVMTTGLQLSSKVISTTATSVIGNPEEFRISIPNFTTVNACPAARTGSKANWDALGISADAAIIDEFRKTDGLIRCHINNVQQTMGVGIFLGMINMMSLTIPSKVNEDNPGYKQMVDGFLAIENGGAASGTWEILKGAARYLYNEVGTDGLIGQYAARLVLATVSALILFIIFIPAVIVFPLTILDLLFRFAVIVTIAPIAVACYMFKVTRVFSVNAFKALIQVALTFFFQGVLISIAMGLMTNAIKTITNGGTLNMLLSRIDTDTGFLYTILMPGFWLFALAGIICFFLLGKANSLAAEMVNAAATPGTLGSAIFQVATPVAGAAVNTGVGVASFGVGAATSAGSAIYRYFTPPKTPTAPPP